MGVNLHHEKENNKQDEEAQKPFPVKAAAELIQSSQQWNRNLQSGWLGVQKGDSENTEEIKRRYEQ